MVSQGSAATSLRYGGKSYSFCSTFPA